MGEFLRFVRQHWRRILFRAHKDRRSLAALLLLLGLVGYVVGYGIFLTRNPFAVVILALGSLAAWIIRRSHKKQDEGVFKLCEFTPLDTAPSDLALSSLRSETIRLWLLLWRASSEAFLKEKHLPEQVQVVTRRAVLDRLEALKVRDDLSPGDIDLHLLPDGAWSKESIGSALSRTAELEALRYACGAIPALSPIEDFDRIPRFEIESVRALADDPSWHTRESYDIRRERDLTASFYLRCLAEQERRGIVPKRVDQEMRDILDQASKNAGSNDSDLLIGTKIVSEVDDEKLQLAAVQAWFRASTLQHVLSLFEEEQAIV